MVSSGLVQSKHWFIPFLTGVLIAFLLLSLSAYVFVSRLNGFAYIEHFMRPDARFVSEQEFIDVLKNMKRLNEDNLLINAKYSEFTKRFDRLSTLVNTSLNPVLPPSPSRSVSSQSDSDLPIKKAHLSKLEQLQRDCAVHVLQFNQHQNVSDLKFINENCG